MTKIFNEKKFEAVGGALKEEKVEKSILSFHNYEIIESKKHINVVIKMLKGPLSGFEKELMPRPVYNTDFFLFINYNRINLFL